MIDANSSDRAQSPPQKPAILGEKVADLLIILCFLVIIVQSIALAIFGRMVKRQDVVIREHSRHLWALNDYDRRQFTEINRLRGMIRGRRPLIPVYAECDGKGDIDTIPPDRWSAE